MVAALDGLDGWGGVPYSLLGDWRKEKAVLWAREHRGKG